MKKILILMMLGLCMSCSKPTEEQVSISYGQKCDAVKFNYDGHQYIVFKWSFRGPFGVVHDPNCKCNIK